MHHWLNGHEFEQTPGDSEDREAWLAAVHGITESWTWLSDCCCCCCVASVVSDSVWPHRWQPTRLPVPGVLQARTLEWVAISFSNAWKWKVKVKSLSRVRFLATPWTTAYQAPPSVGFSRQEYWSGVPLPSPDWVTEQQQFRIILMYYKLIQKSKLIFEDMLMILNVKIHRNKKEGRYIMNLYNAVKILA